MISSTFWTIRDPDVSSTVRERTVTHLAKGEVVSFCPKATVYATFEHFFCQITGIGKNNITLSFLPKSCDTIILEKH